MLNKNKKGFTLVELLITIFVFTVGILGVYLIVQNLISVANYAKYRLTTIYLAQEGIEIVRNIRDTNWVEGSIWDDGLPQGSNFGVQYDSTSLMPNYGNIPLKKDANGFYVYNGTQDTPFRRNISIEKPDDHTLIVTVEVNWSDKFSPTVIKSKLYNWIPR
ncbi:MAG: prepilin-type N-terminal cleavage/methylation domain-containing protein [Candidatus Pacebacteria bacterium]|nr:prepilin-type N-terminal cleavage/methylation domain-containing protein [Candidatus Paceibacterota bacterium]